MKNFLFLWVKLNECVVLDLKVPSEVQKLKAEKRGENFIDIGWYLPKRINGDLQQFVVTYQEGESGVFFFCKFGIGQVPIQFRQLSLNIIQLENLYVARLFIHSFIHSSNIAPIFSIFSFCTVDQNVEWITNNYWRILSFLYCM